MWLKNSESVKKKSSHSPRVGVVAFLPTCTGCSGVLKPTGVENLHVPSSALKAFKIISYFRSMKQQWLAKLDEKKKLLGTSGKVLKPTGVENLHVPSSAPPPGFPAAECGVGGLCNRLPGASSGNIRSRYFHTERTNSSNLCFRGILKLAQFWYIFKLLSDETLKSIWIQYQEAAHTHLIMVIGGGKDFFAISRLSLKPLKSRSENFLLDWYAADPLSIICKLNLYLSLREHLP